LVEEQTKFQAAALDELQAALAIAGDRKAFELLYRRWHPRLLRHARRLVGHSDDAQDVLQDAALAIARNIHRLQSPSSFGPWAYTIIRNRAANHIKRKQRDRSLKDEFQREADSKPRETTTNNQADDLRDLFRTLPMMDQEVLSAYYVDGMSVNEISLCLSKPSGTIKSRLHSARTRLKAAYDSMKGYQNE